jgi:hypothetical protein
VATNVAVSAPLPRYFRIKAAMTGTSVTATVGVNLIV